MNDLERAEMELIAKTAAWEVLNNFQGSLKGIGKIAALEALENVGAYNDSISQRKSYKIYGEGKIKALVRENKISRHKTGERNSMAYYSRKEIETALLNLK